MSNFISEDFPLRGQYERYNPRPPQRIKIFKPSLINFYNNETPDIFKLPTMSESKDRYHNPFMDEVIQVDRSEEFKRLDFTRKQIKFIDRIKSRREYSQNPEILKYIRSDFDIEMQKKRESLSKDKENKKQINRYVLNAEDSSNRESYIDTLNILNRQVPKIPFRLKHNLDLDKLTNLSSEINFKVPIENLKDVETLKCSIDTKKTGYIGNFNDYNISEAYCPDKSKLFYFDKKPRVEYNCIKDKIETSQSAKIDVPKWSPFTER